VELVCIGSSRAGINNKMTDWEEVDLRSLARLCHAAAHRIVSPTHTRAQQQHLSVEEKKCCLVVAVLVSLVGGSTTAHTQLLPHPGLDRDTQVAKERAEELKIAEELEGESCSLSVIGTALHAMRSSIKRNTHVNSLSATIRPLECGTSLCRQCA
jgi:CHAD domain-containing protein